VKILADQNIPCVADAFRDLGEVELGVSFQDLHAVLTDYSRYREWMPGVTRSRVLVREGDIAVVELEALGYAARPVTFEFVCTTPERIVFSQVGQLRVRVTRKDRH